MRICRNTRPRLHRRCQIDFYLSFYIHSRNTRIFHIQVQLFLCVLYHYSPLPIRFWGTKNKRLLPFLRPDELDLEAAGVGGLAVAAAGIVEVEDGSPGGSRVPSHQTSQTLRPCPNSSPTTPFRLSAVLQATLRRTSDNPPPYFDASKAESLIEQGGESRHVRRRVSPSRAKRVPIRGRRQCRRRVGS